MGKASIYLDADGKDPEEGKEIMDRSWSPECLKTRALQGLGEEKECMSSGFAKLRLS